MDRERITAGLKSAGADEVYFSDDHGHLIGIAVIAGESRTARAWHREYDGASEAVTKLKEWLASRKAG